MCASAPIHAERIQQLNAHDIQTRQYVLYWMQQSQRADENHTLEYAIHAANDLKQPLVIVFGLTDAYPEANLRHYTFLLEGLRETAAALAARGIKFVLRRGHPPEIVVQLGKSASLIVCDCGYLRHQHAWRDDVAQQAECRVMQVESDVIVPLEIASNKAEYAARTLRPKIMKQVKRYLSPIPRLTLEHSSLDLDLHGDDFADIPAFLSSLNIDRRIAPVSRFFRGGTSEAKRRFREFIEQRLPYYDHHSNQPQTDDISQMSPTTSKHSKRCREPARQNRTGRACLIEELGLSSLELMRECK
ncbi:deoxyribodipyrimidine photolyase [Candidatus Moduliflexus flocculans]|uniref:Deoxyribodipyrimidine photolyase n=1 Tax=Candidatus Moduliflexus flocculans TaxID=1499966 RepID=A0A081BTE2_9BACT|nr:deoxyribodipyrimidine photolyase [Candidatus Moduliflexus flocculans]